MKCKIMFFLIYFFLSLHGDIDGKDSNIAAEF